MYIVLVDSIALSRYRYLLYKNINNTLPFQLIPQFTTCQGKFKMSGVVFVREYYYILKNIISSIFPKEEPP